MITKKIKGEGEKGNVKEKEEDNSIIRKRRRKGR